MSQRNRLDLPKGPAWSEEWCNGIGTSYKMFFFLVFFAFALFCFFLLLLLLFGFSEAISC